MPIGLSSPDGTTVYFSADEAEHIGFLRGPLEIGALESEGASFLVPIAPATVELVAQHCQTLTLAKAESWTDRALTSFCSNRLMLLEPLDAFSLLRAAKWLDCDLLFSLLVKQSACLLHGKTLAQLSEEWEVVDDSSPAPAGQPLFVAVPSTVSPSGKFADMLGDDDAIEEVLKQCRLETLYELRQASAEWFAATQCVLHNASWRQGQHSVQIDRLVEADAQHPASQAHWDDMVTIALEMPHLQQIFLRSFDISLKSLRCHMSSLDRTILHHETRSSDYPAAGGQSDSAGLQFPRRGSGWYENDFVPWHEQDDALRYASAAPPQYVSPFSLRQSGEVSSGGMQPRICLQLLATMHTMVNSLNLFRVDLTGLLPDDMSLELASAFATVVKRSNPNLKELILCHFCISLDFLADQPTRPRGPEPRINGNFEYWGRGETTAGTWRFAKKGMVPADLRVLCEGGGLLGHVLEIDISRNNLCDGGVAVLTDSLRSRVGLLDNLAALILDHNRIGDTGCLLLCDALCDGVLPILEQLGLVHNLITNEGCAARHPASSHPAPHPT